MKLVGKAWKFGADVDTDAIIPARHLNTTDPGELATHCMEDANPEFAGGVRRGDFIVAGKNFGCGSSREHAPVAIKGAGVSCVIATSFARIFYRNAFNIGLLILESEEAAKDVENGDELSVDIDSGVIENLSNGKTYKSTPIPGFMQQIINSGGLVNYVAERVKD
ncbi:MAG TPA: 3-isopropylmalate dehydratase small subunit [Clostridia bacterium]|nr:3-isopropylmalate dehydratase small subunit [Clostridia bacterium]